MSDLRLKANIRILIVDCQKEVAAALRQMLSSEPDFEIVGATNRLKEGIELAKEHNPDVVMMEASVSRLNDGFPATAAIKQLNPHILVIMLSFQSEPEFFHRAMQVGASEYMVKPNSREELVMAIRRVYSSKVKRP